MPDTQGPFHSESAAREAARRRSAPAEIGTEANRVMLLNACAAAGVEPGAYDLTILGWLAGLEPAMCAVVAGLILRAASSQVTKARDTEKPNGLDDWEF